MLAFYVTGGWKAAKWLEIRDKTENVHTCLSLTRFWAYIKERVREDKQEAVLIELGKAKVFDDDDKEKKEETENKKLRVLKQS